METAQGMKTGDLCYISSNAIVVKDLQKDHGEWNDEMTACLGKIALVKKVKPNGDLSLQVGAFSWIVNPKATRKIGMEELLALKQKHKSDTNFVAGDLVEVLGDEQKVKDLQDGHGGWADTMQKYLGKIGVLEHALPSGDLQVRFQSTRLRLNRSAALRVVPCQASKPLGGIPDAIQAFSKALGGHMRTGNKTSSGITVGELRYISSDLAEVKALQEDHGGWLDEMKFLLGKIAYVKFVFFWGDLRVKVGPVSWTLNPKATRKITPEEFVALKQKHGGDTQFKAYDIVELLSDESRVKEFQAGHGDWVNRMRNHLGKFGYVKGISAQGDLRVRFGDECWRMSPKAVRKVALCQDVCRRCGNCEGEHVDGDSFNDHDEWNPLDGMMDECFESKFFIAVKNNDVKGVRKRLENGADVNEVCHGNTPIQLACHLGYSDMMKLLIEYKADMNIQDGDGDYIIHDAVGIKNCELVRILLDAGANPNVHNTMGLTPLKMAVEMGFIRIAQILVKEKANVNIQDNDGNTPLHHAMVRKSTIIVQLLLDNGADLSLKNSKGLNAFHIAATQGKLKPLRCIVEHYKKKEQEFRVDEKNEDGFTALHLAALSNNMECVRLLIEDGAAEKDALNNKGETPLYLATVKCLDSMVNLLLEAGCNPDITNSNDDTALHEAFRQLSLSREQNKLFLNALLGVKSGNSKAASVIALYLTEKGADPGMKNKEGQSPMDLCQDAVLKQKVLDAARLYEARNPLKTAHRRIAVTEVVETENVDPRQTQNMPDDIEDKIAKLERLQAQIKQKLCPICLECDKNVIFSCGHGCCKDCSQKVTTCPICRVDIVQRIFTYD